jgi:DNA repair photolyase
LNSEEIPALIKAAADHGASMAGYTIVRLNGAIGPIFTDWVNKNFPDRAEKVLNQISEAHGGQLNDSRFGTRMRGEGKIVESIKQMFTTSVARHIKSKNRQVYELDLTAFRVPAANGQLGLFDGL